MEVEDLARSSSPTNTSPATPAAAAVAASSAVQPMANDKDDNSNTNLFVARPGPHDVLMGRGAPMSEHEGNARLRKIVLARHADYVDPAKQRPGKHAVAVEIVQDVRAAGGRFLRKTEAAEWQVVQDEKEIIRKVKEKETCMR